MEGHVRIYINQKTKKIYLVEAHLTKIGFIRDIGELIETTKENIKVDIKEQLKASLLAYKKDRPPSEWRKKTKYKTWNKFFKEHQLIGCDYNDEKKEYFIRLPEKELATHSYGETISGYGFTISGDEFDEKFDGILEFLLSKVEYFPEK